MKKQTLKSLAVLACLFCLMGCDEEVQEPQCWKCDDKANGAGWDIHFEVCGPLTEWSARKKYQKDYSWSRVIIRMEDIRCKKKEKKQSK